MADISDFLSMNPDDVQEQMPLPEGSYDFVITSYRTDIVGENQNEIVRSMSRRMLSWTQRSRIGI